MKIKNEKTGKIKDIRLPKRFKIKWIKALRSEQYKQGSYTLFNSNNDSYCCLGVACNIVHPNVDISKNGLIGKESYIYNKLSKLPNILKGSNDTREEDYNPIVKKLIVMNDSGKHSFKSIATYIERYL